MKKLAESILNRFKVERMLIDKYLLKESPVTIKFNPQREEWQIIVDKSGGFILEAFENLSDCEGFVQHWNLPKKVVNPFHK